MINKEKKSEKSNKVARQKSFRISLKHLAELHGVKKTALTFALAETSDGEDGWDISPILIIKGTNNYIDLSLGQLNQSSNGLMQKFYAAAVLYNRENECFCFYGSKLKAEVSKETLCKNFGDKVVLPSKI